MRKVQNVQVTINKLRWFMWVLMYPKIILVIIWYISEMKKNDQILGKKKRKIPLLVGNCSFNKKVPQLQNIEQLFIKLEG